MDMFNGWLKGLTDTLDTENGMGALQGWLEKMKPTFVLLAKALGLFVAGLVKMAEYGAPIAEKFLTWLIEFGPKIVDWMKETWEKYGPIAIDVLRIMGKLLAQLWNGFTIVVDAARPIIDIIIAIVEKVLDISGAIVEFAEKSGFVDILRGAFELLAKPIEVVVGLIDKIIAGIKFLQENPPSSWIAGSRDELTDPGSQLTPLAMSGYRANPETIPEGWKLSPDGSTLVRGASGAIVTRPTEAVIGEAGPEAVVPLSSMPGARPLGLGGGAGGREIMITGDLHFHGVQNINDFVSQVQKYVTNLPRESGSEMSSG
jgi:hypothetical protein